MSGGRRGGIISFQVGGLQQEAKGTFTYNVGSPKREAIIGADAPHGYKETPQVGFIEGAISDSPTLSMRDLTTFKNGTVTLVLPTGKTVICRDAYYAGEGTGSTEEGEIPVRYEGKVEEV